MHPAARRSGSNATGTRVTEATAWYQQQCAERWAGVLAVHPELAGWMQAVDGSAGEGAPGAPSWARLPVALASAWASADSFSSELLEVLWGQHAVFYAIRLQDDLLDAHRGDLRLQFLADHFIVESLEALQPLRQLDAAFWAEYRAALRGTADGILEVARLQAEPGGFGAAHLQLHARVNAIFRIGTAGACWLHGRRQELDWIREFQAWLAVFDQIIDDLEDVQEDVAAGRYTFVANALVGARPGESLQPGAAAIRLHHGLLDPRAAEPIWAELRRAAVGAASCLPQEAPDEFVALASDMLSAVEHLQEIVHRSRVQLLFGPELTGRQHQDIRPGIPAHGS